MTIVWADTASFTVNAPDGVANQFVLYTIPPGVSGATVLVAFAFADITAGSPPLGQAYSSHVQPVIGDPAFEIGPAGEVVLDGLGNAIAGQTRGTMMLFTVTTDLSGAQVVADYTQAGSGRTIAMPGVIAVAVDDRVGLFEQPRKATTDSNTGTIVSDLTIPGFPEFAGLGFFAFGADIAASSPASLIDFSGGATTDWTNVTRIVNGKAWAGLGELPIASIAGLTTPYNFTNMSPRVSMGTAIAELFGTKPAGRGWAQVVG